MAHRGDRPSQFSCLFTYAASMCRQQEPDADASGWDVRRSRIRRSSDMSGAEGASLQPIVRSISAAAATREAGIHAQAEAGGDPDERL